jgi:hypothetical protein
MSLWDYDCGRWSLDFRKYFKAIKLLGQSIWAVT